MANPNNPIDPNDIHYQDRGGCFVLVDPAQPVGQRDIASAWEEAGGRWRWRPSGPTQPGVPHPSAESRDGALEAMLAMHRNADGVEEQLAAQRTRWSFGEPQIVRV